MLSLHHVTTFYVRMKNDNVEINSKHVFSVMGPLLPSSHTHALFHSPFHRYAREVMLHCNQISLWEKELHKSLFRVNNPGYIAKAASKQSISDFCKRLPKCHSTWNKSVYGHFGRDIVSWFMNVFISFVSSMAFVGMGCIYHVTVRQHIV